MMGENVMSIWSLHFPSAVQGWARERRMFRIEQVEEGVVVRDSARLLRLSYVSVWNLMAEECFDYIFFSFLLLFILSLLSLFGLLVSLFYASYSSIQDRSPNDLDIFWGLFVCFQSKLQKVKLGQSPIEIIRKPKGRKKERKEERKNNNCSFFFLAQ